MPNFLIYVCNVLKEEFDKKKLDNSSLDNFIHQEYNKCNIALRDNIKLLQKSIANLNIRNIHKLFYHYCHMYNKKTDTSIIFLTNLSKSNQERVCYTSQPKRLVYYESWIENFYNLLYNSIHNKIYFIMNRFPGKVPDMLSVKSNFPGFWDIAQANTELKQQVEDQKTKNALLESKGNRTPIKRNKEDELRDADEARTEELIRVSGFTKKKLREWFKIQIESS